jgi:cold shock CspA family protein
MKKFRAKIGLMVISFLLATVLLGGCTVENGVFMGMSQSSSDTALTASYLSFDGSFARRVTLKTGDEVTFTLEGGDGLSAVIKKSGEDICSISNGSAFITPEDGQYDFTMQGEAKDGSFSLSWQID